VEIVEHCTLSKSETRLDWEATVINPGTFTAPEPLGSLHFIWMHGEKIDPFGR